MPNRAQKLLASLVGCLIILLGELSVEAHARQHIASSTSITAVLNNGVLSLWGRNFLGGVASGQSIRIPNVKLVAVGSERLVAYTKDGGIWAWGRVGVKTQYAAPERVGDIPNVADLSTRGFNGLVLLENGKVLEWTGFKFIKIPHFDNVEAISAGKFHSLFLDRQGDVWLINKQFDKKNVPVKIATNIKQISAGDEHSLLLRKDGKVFAFGKNSYGQLGDGSFASADKLIECLIPSNFSIDRVVAGSDFSLALTGDGKVLGWGRNDRGQLGLGNSRNRNSPQPIIGINEIVELSAGELNAFGVSKDNKVFFWGENPDGYIPGAGNGVTSIPKEIRMVY